jgi:hypothetical protein
MFYHAFAGVPEWAPPGENHILYSEGILRNVQYDKELIKYTATGETGTEYLRLAFKPSRIELNGDMISGSRNLIPGTCILKRLGNGDYSLTIKHKKSGDIVISG